MKLKIIFFITVTSIVMLFVFVQRNDKKSQPIFTSAAQPVITPVQTETLNFMDSPEGSKTLTLVSNSLSILSKPDGQKILIFKNEKTDPYKLEIPYNTWSPDNVYVFLKEKTPTIDDYLVFQSSGNIFPNNSAYVSIQELFKKDVPDYSIEDVTGWAAPNLLIVNTKANETGNKVSFWFDVPSLSFIQLGTYFK